METLRGYSLKGRKGLYQWDALLEEWMLAVERYSRIMGGDDAAYWHNERSNIGLLAAAAWRCGRIALEEFPQIKGFRNKSKKRGRCDLWIATDMDEELIEAKFRWVALRADNTPETIEDVMETAARDAKRTRGNSTDIRTIAIGFFPVYVSMRYVDDIDKLIESKLAAFRCIEYHALAWCFPKENRKVVAGGKNLCPGIVMVVKNIDF